MRSRKMHLLLVSKEGLVGKGLGFGAGDAEDEHANATLGNDVRHAVAHLDPNDGVCSGGAQHGDDVHDGVGAPADDGHELGGADLLANVVVGLLVGGLGQSDDESVHDVDERDL